MPERSDLRIMKTKNTAEKKGRGVKEILSGTLVRVLCVIAAFCLWLYVEEARSTTVEAQFDLIKIETRYEEELEANSLVVQYMSHDTVNVTLTGTKNALREVSHSDITAYVDLSEISEAGEYQCRVKLTVPTGFAASLVTDLPVTVYVDRAESAEFEILGEDILYDSWSISSDCVISKEKSSVNINKVIVEGPTLEIEKIASVKVKTQAMGMISTDVSSICTLEYYDSEGNVLEGLNVKGTAYYGAEAVKDIVAYIKLIKQKEVSLTVESEHGYVKGITVEPSKIIIMGSPSVVDSISSISVGKINEKNIVGADEIYEEVFNAVELPEGITGIATADGNKIENMELSVTVKANVGKCYVLTVPKEFIQLVNDMNFYSADSEVKVRIADGYDETLVQLLQKQLNDGVGGITLIADAKTIDKNSKTANITSVLFSSELQDKIYLVGENTVNITVSENNEG